MDTANPGDPQVRADGLPTGHTGRIPADTFSNRLLLARRLCGLTIREASAQTGLNYGSWSNWENGMRPQDMVETCRLIAEALDVDFNWLLLGGPLAGPRGMPTKRPSGVNKGYPRPVPPGEGDNRRYLDVNIRPPDGRPSGRPAGRGDRVNTGPSRRPVRISRPQAA